MKKKHYIQPDIDCYQFNCGQELMTGSSIEAEVFNDEFDPGEMESLSRRNNFDLWTEE
jgi:hypothetical protein